MQTLPHLLRSFGVLTSAALLSFGACAQNVTAGDAQAARSKVAMCIGCHGIPGYQSSFPEVHKVPKISGQNAAYLAAALTAYRKGDRKHPSMKAIATSLSDQDIADLAAYYAAHGQDLPPSPAKGGAASPDVQALLTRGNCVACHGENLNKPIDPSYPKLGGQHADYLYVALKAYHTTNNPNIGRANPIMAAQVLAFTPKELKQLAQHIASLPSDLKTVPQSKLR
ncbi:MAG: c-type cytochrome [Aquabacterium sp.]|jgi:cytochrome c553|uniref:c-type cytochrome n=1 Tax=Aquabacterium sp. TaxID=1872578 RepID=UPI002A35E9F5|nr:c-type cytochrome [Aquabacterium sp.]MDX9842785.1 c-type cytochrome [Aquabacterium sp.]